VVQVECPSVLILMSRTSWLRIATVDDEVLVVVEESHAGKVSGWRSGSGISRMILEEDRPDVGSQVE